MAFGRLRVDEIETSTQTISVDALAAGGVADGDKGDITVSGSGTVWTIDDGAVDTSALGGDITAAGKALLDDADAAAQRTTLGLGGSATLNVGTTAGTVAAGDALGAHVAAADPHPNYALESNLASVATSGAYSDLSGTPTIPPAADAAPQPLGTAAIGVSTDYAREDHVHAMPSATDVGADPTGTAASIISTHEAAADPHPGYALESSLATVATSGAYSDLSGTPTLVANLNDLGDVDLTTTPPADGEALVYDSATGDWVPGAAGAAGATAAGSANEIQYNDGSSGLAASADLTWDDTGKVLGVGGDIDLDDGGTYTTTLQVVTPTANRTISFPNATGTLALVAGSSGQLVYNNAGANAGLSTATIGATGDITLSLNGAASTPPLKLTGTWFVGANSKPQVLIEPAGTTSTAWSTSGTGLGVNAASGFAGNLLDLRLNGASRAIVSSSGSLTLTPASNGVDQGIEFTASNGLTNSYIRNFPNAGALTIRSPGLVKIDTTKLRLPNLPTYADNTAATSGGLVAGDVYKTATGELRITV